MPHRHAVYGDYRVCDECWQQSVSRQGNHIVRSLYEADTQPLKSVLVITGEARNWAVQIGTCIKLRSNYTYSDTSKCISNRNMVLTFREEPITTMQYSSTCVYLSYTCDSTCFMVVYRFNQKAGTAFVRRDLEVMSAMSIGYMEGD